MSPSKTMAVSGRAKELVREGRPVIELSAGEPDFDTPEPIKEAAIRAIEAGYTKYTANAGVLELREAICRKLEEENGVRYHPSQIVCSNGAKQSVAQAIMALTQPDDEVLIPAPYWVSYPEMVVLSGGTPVVVPTTAEAGYLLTAEQLEAAITEKTRLLILCSPSNPTGAVYPRARMEELAEVLRRHEQVYVLSDEIYEYIVFGEEHVCFASLPGMLERTITVNGFSKSYAMTGWRLGYLAAPKAIASATDKIQSQTTSAPCHITQRAGIAALEMGLDPIREMVEVFRARRDFVLDRLNRIPGVRCPKPGGAFYLFPDVSAYLGTDTPTGHVIHNSDDLCMYLLEDWNVALVPGGAFGDSNGLRISYAASNEELEQALHRIETGLAGLRPPSRDGGV